MIADLIIKTNNSLILDGKEQVFPAVKKLHIRKIIALYAAKQAKKSNPQSL
jgi:hypothetical protein